MKAKVKNQLWASQGGNWQFLTCVVWLYIKWRKRNIKLLPGVTYLVIIQEAIVPFYQICWGLSVSEAKQNREHDISLSGRKVCGDNTDFNYVFMNLFRWYFRHEFQHLMIIQESAQVNLLMILMQHQRCNKNIIIKFPLYTLETF